MQREEILEAVRESDHDKVMVAIVDIDGVLRGKYMHKKKFLSAAEDHFGFCNVVFGWDSADVCYDNVTYTGWHSGYPDAKAQVDLGTFRQIPWDERVPFFLADFVGDGGEGLAICPRQLLKRVIARAEKAGYDPHFACEYEWFNFNETPESLAEKGFSSFDPITPGMFGYSVLRASYDQPYFSTLMDDLGAFGIPLEGLHTETGPGVFEAAIMVSGALEAADRAAIFKTAVKQIAYRFGVVPSFMARWNTTLPGCSGHLHQSLWSRDDEGKNLFHDESGERGLSPLFRRYLAGQMALLPDLLPLYAPTVNSYKRLVEGFWAPTRVTWGIDNRTAAFRAIPGSPKSTRIETRVTGSDINPYLAIAASLASGLWGVEQGLTLEDDPVVGDAYALKDAVRLPKNLYAATRQLEASTTARELLGDEFVDHFVKTRDWEWRQFERAVTSWELKRYFEII